MSGVDGDFWGQVRVSRTSDEIVARLRDALFEGKLLPGDPLGPEIELAAKFGVSRTSVREAMRALEASGIIEVGMGRRGGARIALGDPKRFAQALAVQLRLVGVTSVEVLDARIANEWMAARLAATEIAPAELAHLQNLIDRSEEAQSDLDRLDALSREFHAAVTEASHNRVVIATLTSIREALRMNRIAGERVERMIAIHRTIVQALRDHDAERAGELMREDLQRQRTFWERRLKHGENHQ